MIRVLTWFYLFRDFFCLRTFSEFEFPPFKKFNSNCSIHLRPITITNLSRSLIGIFIYLVISISILKGPKYSLYYYWREIIFEIRIYYFGLYPHSMFPRNPRCTHFHEKVTLSWYLSLPWVNPISGLCLSTYGSPYPNSNIIPPFSHLIPSCKIIATLTNTKIKVIISIYLIKSQIKCNLYQPRDNYSLIR